MGAHGWNPSPSPRKKPETPHSHVEEGKRPLGEIRTWNPRCICRRVPRGIGGTLTRLSGSHGIKGISSSAALLPTPDLPRLPPAKVLPASAVLRSRCCALSAAGAELSPAPRLGPPRAPRGGGWHTRLPRPLCTVGSLRLLLPSV